MGQWPATCQMPRRPASAIPPLPPSGTPRAHGCHILSCVHRQASCAWGREAGRARGREAGGRAGPLGIAREAGRRAARHSQGEKSVVAAKRRAREVVVAHT